MDPGYLGYLCLQWQPPLSLDNFKECTVEYVLKYRNIGNENWKVSRACTCTSRVIIGNFLVIHVVSIHSNFHISRAIIKVQQAAMPAAISCASCHICFHPTQY